MKEKKPNLKVAAPGAPVPLTGVDYAHATMSWLFPITSNINVLSLGNGSPLPISYCCARLRGKWMAPVTSLGITKALIWLFGSLCMCISCFCSCTEPSGKLREQKWPKSGTWVPCGSFTCNVWHSPGTLTVALHEAAEPPLSHSNAIRSVWKNYVWLMSPELAISALSVLWATELLPKVCWIPENDCTWLWKSVGLAPPVPEFYYPPNWCPGNLFYQRVKPSFPAMEFRPWVFFVIVFKAENMNVVISFNNAVSSSPPSTLGHDSVLLMQIEGGLAGMP